MKPIAVQKKNAIPTIHEGKDDATSRYVSHNDFYESFNKIEEIEF